MIFLNIHSKIYTQVTYTFLGRERRVLETVTQISKSSFKFGFYLETILLYILINKYGL